MKLLTQERLNLIIALCAALISAASFYATYLQADAANKQVRAMTHPLIKFSHGNYDRDSDDARIYLSIENAGIGPALVKKVEFNYKGDIYYHVDRFIDACCRENAEKFYSVINTKTNQLKEVGPLLTATAREEGLTFSHSSLYDAIIPGQSKIEFFSLPYGEISKDFWEQLNRERMQLGLSVCYCSLLDDCFVSKPSGKIKEVASCPVSLGHP